MRHVTDRIQRLGATVFRVPAAEELPALVSKVARLWAEIHEADAALAEELARALPEMEIRRAAPEPMGPEELRTIGERLWGYGWQSALARAFGVNPRTVRRWAAGDSPVPDDIAASLREGAER